MHNDNTHLENVIWAAQWGRPTMHAYTNNVWQDATTCNDLTTLCGRTPTESVWTATPSHIEPVRCRSCERAEIRLELNIP